MDLLRNITNFPANLVRNAGQNVGESAAKEMKDGVTEVAVSLKLVSENTKAAVESAGGDLKAISDCFKDSLQVLPHAGEYAACEIKYGFFAIAGSLLLRPVFGRYFGSSTYLKKGKPLSRPLLRAVTSRAPKSKDPPKPIRRITRWVLKATLVGGVWLVGFKFDVPKDGWLGEISQAMNHTFLSLFVLALESHDDIKLLKSDTIKNNSIVLFEDNRHHRKDAGEGKTIVSLACGIYLCCVTNRTG